MKRGPLLIGIAAVVVVAVAIGVYTLVASLDRLVKAAIEEYGSEITGTQVRVASVKIQLAEGRGTIRGLTVGNPAGYSSANAFELDQITLEIDPGSVTENPIVIDELTIVAPAVRVELDAAAKSNIDAILANVKRYQGSGTATGAAEGGGGDAERRLAIRRFAIQGGQAAVDAQALAGDGNLADVKLPALAMNNLGGKRGAPAAEIAAVVMRAYSEKIVAAVVRGQLGGRAGEFLEKQGEAGKAAKRMLDGILNR